MPEDRLLAAIEQALAGGVDAVLVREKQMDSARLLAFAAKVRALTTQAGARLLVHTQADVAMATGADGVHVASAAIAEIPAMRAWCAHPEMSFSASCHSPDELSLAAAAGADFALLSPVFPTQSHPGEPALGAAAFKTMCEHAALPVVALGGIHVDNRQQLAGFGVAVIGAVLDAAMPDQAARALRMHSATC